MYYTIGQRRGLGIEHGSGLDPLYVVRIDAKTSEVIVGPRAALLRSRIYLDDINWLGEGGYGTQLVGQAVYVKLRSTTPPRPAKFALDGNHIIIELDEPDEAVAPGQACVFYAPEDGYSRTLGGGWIVKAEV